MNEEIQEIPNTAHSETGVEQKLTPTPLHQNGLEKEKIEARINSLFKEEKNLDVPDFYKCPITQKRMIDPVIAANGQSYERAAIEERFKRGESIDPVTDKQFAHTSLIPNRYLKEAIEGYSSEQAALQQKILAAKTNLSQAIAVQQETYQKPLARARQQLADSQARERDLENSASYGVNQQTNHPRQIIAQEIGQISEIEFELSELHQSIHYRKSLLQELEALQSEQAKKKQALETEMAGLETNHTNIQTAATAEARQKIDTFNRQDNLDAVIATAQEAKLHKTKLEAQHTLEKENLSQIHHTKREQMESDLSALLHYVETLTSDKVSEMLDTNRLSTPDEKLQSQISQLEKAFYARSIEQIEVERSLKNHLGTQRQPVNLLPSQEEKSTPSARNEVRSLEDKVSAPLKRVLNNKDDLEFPKYFECGVSLHPMIEPVVVSSGNTFNRTHIQVCIKQDGKDPITRNLLILDCIIPNDNLKSAIEAFSSKHAELQKTTAELENSIAEREITLKAELAETELQLTKSQRRVRILERERPGQTLPDILYTLSTQPGNPRQIISKKMLEITQLESELGHLPQEIKESTIKKDMVEKSLFDLNAQSTLKQERDDLSLQIKKWELKQTQQPQEFQEAKTALEVSLQKEREDFESFVAAKLNKVLTEPTDRWYELQLLAENGRTLDNQLNEKETAAPQELSKKHERETEEVKNKLSDLHQQSQELAVREDQEKAQIKEYTNQLEQLTGQITQQETERRLLSLEQEYLVHSLGDNLETEYSVLTLNEQKNEPQKHSILQQQFLNYVADGNEKEAEEMLKANPWLVLARGTIQDRAGRTFDNITAFQYSVWALDWQMWEMILKYLPLEAAKTQWEEQHQSEQVYGLHFDLNPLITALYTCSTNPQKTIASQAGMSNMQRKLPVHFVQEYCSHRSFENIPDFIQLHSRALIANRELLYPKQRDVPIPTANILDEWYTGKPNMWLRSDFFAVLRLEEQLQPHPDNIQRDIHALNALSQTRLTQREKLAKQLKAIPNRIPRRETSNIRLPSAPALPLQDNNEDKLAPVTASAPAPNFIVTLTREQLKVLHNYVGSYHDGLMKQLPSEQAQGGENEEGILRAGILAVLGLRMPLEKSAQNQFQYPGEYRVTNTGFEILCSFEQAKTLDKTLSAPGLNTKLLDEKGTPPQSHQSHYGHVFESLTVTNTASLSASPAIIHIPPDSANQQTARGLSEQKLPSRNPASFSFAPLGNVLLDASSSSTTGNTSSSSKDSTPFSNFPGGLF